MSVMVMSWVWKQNLAPGDKFLLLALADSADDDGTNAWPTVATIAKKVSVSESTVHRRLAKLETDGWIKIEKNAGGSARVRADRRPNMYTILMTGSQSDTPPEPRGVNGDGNGVSPEQQRGVTADTQTILEPSVEPPSGAAAGGGELKDDPQRVKSTAGYITKQVMEKYPFNNGQAVAGIARKGLKAGTDSHLLLQGMLAAAESGGPFTVDAVKYHIKMLTGGYERAPRTVDEPGTKVHDNGLDQVLW